MTLKKTAPGLSTTLHIAWEAAVSPKIFVMQQKENLLSYCGYVDFLSGYLGIKPKAIHPLYTSAIQKI